MQLFEELIDHHEAVRLVLKNTTHLPFVSMPLMDAKRLELVEY